MLVLKIIFIIQILVSNSSPDGCVPVIPYPTVIDAIIGQKFGNLNHSGVDFSIPVGTEVYSVLDGIVIKQKDNARAYGRYLMIRQTDGNITLFAHLSSFNVKTGDKVYSGQLIGLSGGDPDDNIDGDGWSSAPHLHFEVRVKEHINNNRYNIEPLEYLESLKTLECSIN